MLPDRYPRALDVERDIADEERVGRMLDYAVIGGPAPRRRSIATDRSPAPAAGDRLPRLA